jgi:hypothetical protein
MCGGSHRRGGSGEEEKSGLRSASITTVTLGITVDESLSVHYFTPPSHILTSDTAKYCSTEQNRTV